jgi:putative ABC transport system substrate-binding protein
VLLEEPPRAAMYRRTATFVKKIIPVEQPTHVELWINMKKAKALGVSVPDSIMVRADRIIE